MPSLKHTRRSSACQKCGCVGELFWYKREYICDKCMNSEFNPLKIEDFVTVRKSLDSYMPSPLGQGTAYQVQKQVRKNGVKSKFRLVPSRYRSNNS